MTCDFLCRRRAQDVSEKKSLMQFIEFYIFFHLLLAKLDFENYYVFVVFFGYFYSDFTLVLFYFSIHNDAIPFYRWRC